MTKLLSVISLILALVLFPPAVLAVVSNNAVPGDSTYPIKRSLEDVIYAVASLNPISQAWFAKARSDRRFQEIVVLTSQGREANKSLNELIEQTQIAANRINEVTDSSQKEKLINQLSESITKYDAGLAQISQREQQINPPAQPIALIAVVPQPTNIEQTPLPSASPLNTPLPKTAPKKNEQIEKVRDDLNKIKKKLEEEKPNQNRREDKTNHEERNRQGQGNKKDKKK